MLASMVGGSVFDPRRIANLQNWYDALDASTITLNSGNVSEWRDKSGNGRHATQASASAQPNYAAAGVLPSAVIAPAGGAVDMALTNSVGVLRNLGGATLIAVHRPAQVAGTQPAVFFSSGTSAFAARAALSCGLTTAALEAGGRRLDANGYQQVNSAATANTAYVHGAIFNYSAATLNMYVNGSVAASSTSYQTSGSTSDTDSVVARLFSNDGGARYIGAIAEVLVFNRAISADEMTALSRYLGRKWGISV